MRRALLVLGLLACAATADAAIAVRGTPTLSVYGTGLTSQVTNKPTGTVQGDVILLFLSLDSQAVSQTPSWPSGFTQQQNRLNGTTGGSEIQLSVASKVAGASEGATYTVMWGSAAGAEVAAITYSGVDQTNPIQTSASQAESGSGNTHTAPTVTATGPGLLVVAFDDFGGGTYSSFGTLTERSATTTEQPNLFDEVLTAAGATGTRSVTAGNNPSRTEISLVLKPAGGNLLTLGAG